MLGTTSLAASAPKTFCYRLGTSFINVMMTMKSMGTINTADGKIKHYAVHGTQLYPGFYPPTPVTGTATFINGVLRFNHTTLVRPAGEPGTTPTYFDHMVVDGKFDTATGTGGANYYFTTYQTAGGTLNASQYPGAILVISCEDLSLAASTFTQNQSFSGMGKYTSESE
jgi:hypothetical protein